MERRKNDRFEIPGAQVVYKLPDGKSSLVPMIDIAKSSVRFLTKHIVDLGSPVEIEILVPDKQNIIVKGNVVRLSDPHQEKITGAVVQFLPFGTFEEYNSLYSYEQLSTLADAYIKH